MNVPVLDLRRQYHAIQSEIDGAIRSVLESGEFILGDAVKRFEAEAAAACGSRHAIGLASGTDALLLSLRALGICPEDAVLVPSFTFFATAGVVHNVGATPVFCDVEPGTFNIDPASARRVLAARAPEGAAGRALRTMHPRIRAIIPVHLYGQTADMTEILTLADEHKLAVIEDAAQAIGATYGNRAAGSLGSLGCFSFYPTKNLGAYGDAGMVTTNDDALADKVRLFRVHGAKPKYVHHVVGINSRLDAIQAAILSVKLRHLTKWTAARQRVAARYDELLGGLRDVTVPYRAEGRSHIFHQYTIRVGAGKRDALAAHLKAAGVGTMIYYPIPLHLQECFAHLGYKEGDFPASESASREVLSLPIFPELRNDEQDYVAAEIRRFVERGL